nr:hypothetical protein [uncultured Cellulosilyticum sp.]
MASIEETIKQIVVKAIDEAIAGLNTSKEVYPRVMNVKQAAKYLGCGTTWIYDNLTQIPHWDCGGTKFNIEDLDKWRLDKTGRSFSVVRK